MPTRHFSILRQLSLFALLLAASILLTLSLFTAATCAILASLAVVVTAPTLAPALVTLRQRK